jgi:hypothetical protein
MPGPLLKPREVPVRLDVTMEVPRGEHCFIYGCGKPLKDAATGKRLGARGMCWAHLKSAQRSGELQPYKYPPPKACIECATTNRAGKAVRPAAKRGLCNWHYNRWHRQQPGYRARYLERERERKRAWRSKEREIREDQPAKLSPKRQRAASALALREVEGLSYGQIAKRLGYVDRSAARKAVKRASV